LTAGEPPSSCRRVLSFLPKTGVPAPPSVIHYSAGARNPASHGAQRPITPLCDCRRVPALPSKRGNSSPLSEGEKRGNLNHKKNAAKGSILLSEENCWSFRRKKPQKPNCGAQGIKTLTKTTPDM
jgi:hypothetical protein